MSLQTTGIVQEIGETKTYPKKEGEGNVDITKLKIEGKYFTAFYIFDEDIKVGSKVDVTYTEKEGEWQGRKIINRNISSIVPHQNIELSPEAQASIEATKKVMEETKTNATNPEFAKKVNALLKGENTITVGDKTYKVTLEEVK